MLIHSHAGSSIGRVRTTNEDAFGCFPGVRLYVVADGIGTSRAGEVASRAVVDSLRDCLLRQGSDLPRAVVNGSGLFDHARKRLELACSEANALVRRLGAASEDLEGMASTFAAVLFDAAGSQLATVAHAGDCRVYRVRGRSVLRLTEDHTLAAQLVREGRLNAAQAEQLRQRHALTRAIGFGDATAPDIRAVDVRPGDVFVLATDGLHRGVADDEIGDLVARHAGDLRAACRALLALADERGGRDNATVVLAALRR